VSFDNDWLAHYGFWNPRTKQLQADDIKNAFRHMMKETLVEEQLADSANWAASIHYNTDNIHIHFAIVEPEPTRPYGLYTNRKTG
ncbi:relaxase MobL, partial [Enterococcus faecalis]